ncbi:hybrid sensor histidine kinase/response regulator [Parabacteroides sp. PF5-6]|uniref:hybrid sensor histidine kinase/response regulator transcription factor n=1 Tax=Parabacteroides sp. PF5-6 TaxID=1742403 RepID=UPI00240621B6|nr:hybrid sensor histidine kinase/response regulator [Parabacteroides sp. PF5-6]
MRWHIVQILTVLFFYPVCLAAHDIHFQTLGSVQGMSQSSAISIWQDHLGRMWLGNDALNCYDGETVEVYRLSDYIEGIEDANLHTITGNDSLLFVIAETQLIRFDLQTETFEAPDIQTNSIFYKDGYLYYASSGSFFRYDVTDRSIEELMLLPVEIPGVRAIESCGEDRFLLATPVGGYVLDVKAKSVLERLLPAEGLVSLMKDSHDNIWMTTRTREIYIATHIRAASFELIPVDIKDEKVRQTDIYCLAEDVNGSVWLGTISGLFQVSRPGPLSGNTLETLNHVMPESSVYSLYSDRQGTLWIGSYSGDVRYFNPEVDNYLYYNTDESHPDRLHGAVIGGMAEDKNGNLYIITEGSGVNIYNPSTHKFEHLKREDGLKHDKIKSLWYDEYYDRVFFGEYMQGLSWYDVKTKRIHSVESGALSTLYQHIIEEIIPYRRFLLLLTQDGIFSLDRETLVISELFQEPELKEACSGIIRSIHIDERDVLWVSSFERGLFTIDMKTRKIRKNYGDGLKAGSIIPSAILDFAENPQKGLFLITLKSGLLFYDPQIDNFQSITEEQQLLLSNICYKAAFSHYGNLIVTSNKGVSVLNSSSRGRFNVVHHYRLSPSFPLVALNGDCGLYSSPSADRIYIGGLYGLFSFSEKDLGAGRDNYSLYFSSLWVNNRLVSPSSGVVSQGLPHTDKIVLPHNRNTLNLTFASTNYLSTRNSWHEYKMEGLEDMWTLTNHKNIIFNSLRPGKYKLLLREVGNENKTTGLAIVIKPPLWATAPAILCYLAFLALALWAIIKFNKSKTSLLASLEVEREEFQKVEEANRKKTDFFINISNEFRTPLTLIMSQLERLSAGLPAKEKKRLEKIGVQTRRLQDLIAELLDFRKMENNALQLHVANYNLNDFLRTIYTTYADVAEERQVHYRYRQLTEAIEIWFDRKQMQKVVYNFHTFIFRYAQPKDHIELVVHLRNKWAEIQLIYDGTFPDYDSINYLFMLLNDESTGNPNLSLLPEGGMGLAFTRGIVKLHQGRITVGKDGDKTLFLICLPLGNAHFSPRELETVPESLEEEVWDNPVAEVIEPGEPEPEELAQGVEDLLPEPGEKTMRLLLVDPDDEMRALLKDSFSFLYEVIEYTQGKAAYRYAEAEQPDLIVTEVNVPGMNGVEFCQALKSNIKTLHIPLVVLSSQPTEKQKTDCIRSGADAYIVKPFNLEFLLLRCNSLVKYRKKILRRELSQPAGSDEFDITTNLRDKNFMLRANQVIEENIGNPEFDTTFWSKALGISRTRLFAQVKDITGLTPNDYILHLKMDKGLSLLNETPLTISEIAYQLGFSIPAYFSKCFKKQFGITPAEYRRNQSGKS